MLQDRPPMRRALLLGSLVLLAACGSGATSTNDDDVTVATGTREARAQYDANVAFARGYTASCRPTGDRPRVLVSGFGRFLDVTNNATGRIVSALTGVRYPETVAPPAGTVDPPGAQLDVGMTTLTLPNIGAVDVCAMIVPVDWDLAAILVAKEADSFKPSFVMMNGVAGARQPLWIELGATNRAMKLTDGTNALVPISDAAPLVEDAPASDEGRPNLLAWDAVRSAARDAVKRHGAEVDGAVAFSEIVDDAVFAGFPRSSNTYLCNNITYVTGFLMDHPGHTESLLRASPPRADKANDVPITMTSDLHEVPRVFVHWPSDLADKHHAAAADVMRSIIAAQLGASAASTRGDNVQADPSLRGGDYF